MEFTFKTEGFKELIDGLDKLVSTPILNKIVKSAIKEGAKPIIRDANSRLGKNAIASSTPKVKVGTASIGIGPKAKIWYYVFREWGTSAHKVIAGGKRGQTGKKMLFDPKTGKFFGKEQWIPAIPSKPFMRPAVDSQKENALREMAKFLELCLQALLKHKKSDVPEVL